MSETRVPDKKFDREDARSSSEVVGKLVPLASVLILAGTFIFSVYQYRSQQQEAARREQVDQIIKINSQMRNDSDALSQFPNTKMTISGAEFLLEDLDGLVQSRIAVDGSKSKSAQDDRRIITKTLYDLVNQDCNFNEQRDVDFSIMVFDSWDDYRNYLKDPKEGPDLIWNLLDKYTYALKDVHDMAAGYIGRLRYSKDETNWDEPDGTTEADSSHLRHFEDLIRGFERHWNLLNQGSASKKEFVKRFQAATCNEGLTKDWLGLSADPRDDPRWFANCGKNNKKG